MCVSCVCVRSLIAQPNPSQDYCTHNAQDVPVNKINTFEKCVTDKAGKTVNCSNETDNKLIFFLQYLVCIVSH